MGKEAKKREFTVSALLFREEGMWIAQCLEMDIVCQAKKLPELQKRFVHSIIAHVSISEKESLDPFRNKAPQRFWDIFEQSDNEIENRNLKAIDQNIHPRIRLADMDSMADCA